MSDQVESVTYTTVLDSDTITVPPVVATVPESDNFVSTFVKETVTYKCVERSTRSAQVNSAPICCRK